MDPDRAKRVETLCVAALDREPGRRAQFVAEACGEDAELRRLAEWLLAEYERAGPFLDTPAWCRRDAEAQASLAPGSRLGPYEVEAFAAAGGMGEVYKGRDTRLARSVAIKLLPAALAADPGRRGRFELEARAASALNHPNICAVHDVGDQDGRPFIVMEWMDGGTLAKAIPSGGFQVARAVALGRQLAAGVAAAHRAGILHRDIKPGNLLLASDGTLKIADFGLAKSADASTVGSVGPLGAGTTALGTPGYAAPEQLEGRGIDARTDVFAIGCVLYELLVGSPAFPLGTTQLTAGTPPEVIPLRKVRPDVPRRLAALIERATSRSPEDRPASAGEVLAELERIESGLATRRAFVAAVARNPVVLAAAVTVVLAASIVAWQAWRRSEGERWVHRTAIPQARMLLARSQDDVFAAFRLLRQAQRVSPGDPQVRELLEEASAEVELSTRPPGADLFIRDFRDGPDDWEHLGRSPLVVPVPAGTGGFVIKVALEGYVTQTLVGFGTWRKHLFTLVPVAGAPRGMAPIPGGVEELFGTRATIDPFWMDATEVTNRAYHAFVEGSGYARPELWRDMPAGLLERLQDRTGQPGPSTWSDGRPPPGLEDHPVGGVSWYEASAYCRSAGKTLPTVFHWLHAALPAATTQWTTLSNFLSPGTQPVARPLTLNTYGTYDMAGNLGEWTSSEPRPGFRYVMGGSYAWTSPTFWEHWMEGVESRPPHVGFRCALYPTPPAAAVFGPVAVPRRDYRTEKPASDEVYAAIAGLYDYDAAKPLDARVESRDEANSQYRLERVSYRGVPADERVPAYLLLPKNASPPYQAVVWYTGGGPFMQSSPFRVDTEMIWLLFLVRSGRAVLVPEYTGSFERSRGPITDPEVWREVVVRSIKDLRRGLDYLGTRPDIDAGRVAFYGLSHGAAVGVIAAAVEPRLKAAVLLGGGLYFWKRAPEADALNFAPRVHAPTLMINGRHDYFFDLETSQKPLFELLGTAPGDKVHLLFDSGHIASERDRYTAEILRWLDRYLGPVRLRNDPTPAAHPPAAGV